MRTGQIGVIKGSNRQEALQWFMTDDDIHIQSSRCLGKRTGSTNWNFVWQCCKQCCHQLTDTANLQRLAKMSYHIDLVDLLWKTINCFEQERVDQLQLIKNRDYMKLNAAGHDLEDIVKLPPAAMARAVAGKFTSIPKAWRNAAMTSFIQSRVLIFDDLINNKDGSSQEVNARLLRHFAGDIARGRILPAEARISSRIMSGQMRGRHALSLLVGNVTLMCENMNNGRKRLNSSDIIHVTFPASYYIIPAKNLNSRCEPARAAARTAVSGSASGSADGTKRQRERQRGRQSERQRERQRGRQ